MIPNPRRINPRVNAASHARAQQRVLWLMARAGYIRRSLASMGAEPTPEPIDETGPEPTEPPAPDAPLAAPLPEEAGPSPAPPAQDPNAVR